MQEASALYGEMTLGRTQEFADYLCGKVEMIFGQRINPEDLKQLRQYIQSGPSRIMADEVTYHLHVALRVKAYDEVLRGDRNVIELPDRLNELYQESFCEELVDPLALIKSDVHPFVGKTALYAGYSIGAVIAAQFDAAISKDHPEHRDRIKKSDFSAPVKWWQDNVFSKGRLDTLPEVIKEATGEGLNTSHLKQHLSQRFTGKDWQPALHHSQLTL